MGYYCGGGVSVFLVVAFGYVRAGIWCFSFCADFDDGGGDAVCGRVGFGLCADAHYTAEFYVLYDWYSADGYQ